MNIEYDIGAGLTFLVPAYPGCRGKEAVKRCLSVCLSVSKRGKVDVRPRSWPNAVKSSF